MKIKKILSVFLAVLLLSSGVSVADTESTVIHIRTADDLLALAESCRLDTWSQDKIVELDADISLDGVDFTPIPIFGGEFRGNGHTIRGLSISARYSRAGLFAEISETGVVKNLTVIGTIDMTGSCEAAGGIAGCNLGSVSGCTNTAYVNTTESDATFSVQDISIDTALDIAKLSTQETVTSFTDSGGIAGYSSGILRSCTNEGVVGYLYVGYNTGGIAGRSCGYVAYCVNHGEVNGRKDTGGIIGQMEPYLEENIDASTLAQMRRQLEELSELLDQTAADAEGMSGAVSSQIESVSAEVSSAVDKIDDLGIDIGGDIEELLPDSPEEILPDIDDLPDEPEDLLPDADDWSGITQPDVSGLVSAINSIGSRLSSLNSAISGASGAVAEDLRAVNEKFSELSETMFDAIFTIGTSEGDILVDASDVDVDTVRLGKVSNCRNTGSVNGDINSGGIAGAMAIEYELDPEDDVSGEVSAEYKREYEMKAVVKTCKNTGSITARRTVSGGIAGRMDLGLVTECFGFGSVSCGSGSYAGGIVGLTSAMVRSCRAKCTVSGAKYVGGIVGSGVSEALTGSGSTVYDCVSLTEITDATEYFGAVAGSDAGDFSGNVFVSDTLSALDGRSISGSAEPISYEDMLQLDNIPDEMRSFTLRFTADDKTLREISFSYGASLSRDVFPDIPEKDGYYADWDTDTLDDLHFDKTVSAVYHAEVTAVASEEKRSDGRSAAFVEGRFDDSAVFSVPLTESGESDLQKTLEESSASLPWYVRIFSPVHGGIIEQRSLLLPENGETSHTVHYLAPENTRGETVLYILRNGEWEKADTEEFGSYLVFTADAAATDIAAVSVIPAYWLWLGAGALLLLCGLILLLALKGRRRKKKEPEPQDTDAVDPPSGETAEMPTETPAEPQDTDAFDPPGGETAEIPTETPAELPKEETAAEPTQDADTSESDAPDEDEAPAKPPKKKKLLPVLLLLLAALIAAAALLYPRIAAKTSPYLALLSLSRSSEFSADLTLSDADESAEIPVSVRTEDGQKIARAEINGIPLWFSDGKVLLENGRAYALGSTLPDYTELLPELAELCKDAAFTSDGETHTVSLSSDSAERLVRILSPELLQNGASAESATLQITVSDGTVRSASAAVAGKHGDGTPLLLRAVLDNITTSSDAEIPDAVAEAAAKDASDLTDITDDVLTLLSAWRELHESESTLCSVTVSGRGGPVALDSAFELSRQISGGMTVYGIGKNNTWLYTDGETVTTADGKIAVDTDTIGADAAGLWESVYLLCLNGEIDAVHHDDASTYMITFSASDAEKVAELLAPECKALGTVFSGGTLQLALSDGEIQSFTVVCSGTVKVALTETAVTVSAEISVSDTLPATVPDRVLTALSE